MYLKFKNLLSPIPGASSQFVMISNFTSNKETFTKMIFILDSNHRITELKYQNSTKIISVYACSYSPSTSSSWISEYQYIDWTNNTMNNWLKNNTTECTGYFENIDGINYFIDMKDSLDATHNIQTNFNTSIILDKYLPTITPISQEYLENNFSFSFDYDYFSLSFTKNNITKYLNIINNNNSYEFSFDDELNCNCIYFIDPRTNCLKFLDLKNNIEKFIVLDSLGYMFYMFIKNNLSTGYAVKLEDNKLIGKVNNISYGFIGTMNTSPNSLNVSPTVTNQADVFEINKINKDIKKTLNYKYNDTAYLGLECSSININFNGIIIEENDNLITYSYYQTCLPYSKLPEINNYGSNIFSGNWLVDGQIINGLTYVLPNSISYTPLYYKQVTIKNVTGLSGLELYISQPNSNGNAWISNEYFAQNKSASSINSNNTNKIFISNKYRSISDWDNYYFRIIPEDTLDVDKACYFSTSPAIENGEADSIVDTLDFWCISFENKLNNISYKLDYYAFNTSLDGAYTDSWETAEISPTNIKTPSYVYSSTIDSNYFSVTDRKIQFNNGNYLPGLYIKEIFITWAYFDAVTITSNGISSNSNLACTPYGSNKKASCTYLIWGCPKLIKQ